MKKTVIIYDRTKNESLVKKNQLKKENPNAVIIEASNKKAISEALKGKGNTVIPAGVDIDKRQAKGDNVKTTTKKPDKKKETTKKKTATKKKK